ncbi:universal stress protein [Streptomyces olivoreticuli]
MEFPVVVGVDGSDSSLRALDWAVGESLRLGLPLRLVYASLWERYEGAVPSLDIERSSEQGLADHITASAVERVRRQAPEVELTSVVRPEEAMAALLEEAHEASVIVVGSRGRGGIAGLLLGSVSLSVAGRSHCPVVVVRRTEAPPATTPHRVVLGVGDAVESGKATRFAFRDAEARKCGLVAVRAWRCPARQQPDTPLLMDGPSLVHRQRAADVLNDALAALERRHPQVDVRRETVEGPAHHVLIKAAADADLLVVGARRRTGRGGLQLGRINHAVLHHAPCPVAIVPERI